MISRGFTMAAGLGFEPRQTESESLKTIVFSMLSSITTTLLRQLHQNKSTKSPKNKKAAE